MKILQNPKAGRSQNSSWRKKVKCYVTSTLVQKPSTAKNVLFSKRCQFLTSVTKGDNKGKATKDEEPETDNNL